MQTSLNGNFKFLSVNLTVKVTLKPKMAVHTIRVTFFSKLNTGDV